MPEYASLCKLMDNMSIDLQNKAFKEAQKFEEMLAIKWILSYTEVLRGQVRFEHNLAIKTPQKATPIEDLVEQMSELPDETPL